MAETGGCTLIFESGVARFDATGNLFVNLPHSADAPLKVRSGPSDTVTVPGSERRARIHGTGGATKVEATLPSIADLPRGLVVEIKGYEGVTVDGGRLVVALPEAATGPDWMAKGTQYVFGAGGGVRLWEKSTIPSGVAIGEAAATAGPKTHPPTQKKPVARGQYDPPSRKVTDDEQERIAAELAELEKLRGRRAAPGAGSEPAAKPASEPYRPERQAAGAYKAGRHAWEKKARGLGCGTLVALAACACLAAALLTSI